MSKYADFDALLLDEIRRGSTTFTALCSKAVLNAADALAVPDRWGDRNGWRVIDRRLQALRKGGRIVYSKGSWAVCEAQS